MMRRETEDYEELSDWCAAGYVQVGKFCTTYGQAAHTIRRGTEYRPPLSQNSQLEQFPQSRWCRRTSPTYAKFDNGYV